MRLLNSRLDLAYPFQTRFDSHHFRLAASLPEAPQKPRKRWRSLLSRNKLHSFRFCLANGQLHAFGTDLVLHELRFVLA
jgi:hypothetical protein